MANQSSETTEDEHPRGSSWCCPVNLDRIETEAPVCWCGQSIIYGIGQCRECLEDADNG